MLCAAQVGTEGITRFEDRWGHGTACTSPWHQQLCLKLVCPGLGRLSTTQPRSSGPSHKRGQLSNGPRPPHAAPSPHSARRQQLPLGIQALIPARRPFPKPHHARRQRLPLGIAVNFNSYAAKLLTQMAFNPGMLPPIMTLGAEAQLQIVDASCLAG